MAIKQSDLSQFIGSTQLYSHWLGIQYTDGVKFLAKNGNAYWLIDAIASHQTKKLLQIPELHKFQLWQLTVNSDKSAILTCKPDNNSPEVVSQKIEFSDFPLPYVSMYLVDKVLMLPSEY